MSRAAGDSSTKGTSDAPVPLLISILSDATGHTAEAVIRAVLVQFPDLRPHVKRFSRVRTKERIVEALDEAATTNDGVGIVIYSLVSRDLRTFLRKEGKERDLVLFDLLGPLIDKMRRLFRLMPLSQPGLLTHVQQETLRTAKAIEFTLKHDDGMGLESIREADLVLMGISRTSKTPTSTYLACNHALKVANFPLLPDEALPDLLRTLKAPKVGLTIEPERLAALRREYMRDLPDYADLGKVHAEVEMGLKTFRLLPGTHVVDVTHRSVEEIASKILEILSN